jgi:hypothetical protein
MPRSPHIQTVLPESRNVSCRPLITLVRIRSKPHGDLNLFGNLAVRTQIAGIECVAQAISQ